MLSAYILYTEYGFWHEQYVREETTLLNDTPVLNFPESPATTFSRLLGDAKGQLKGMKIDTSFLEGKEVYVKPQ